MKEKLYCPVKRIDSLSIKTSVDNDRISISFQHPKIKVIGEIKQLVDIWKSQKDQ